LDTEHWNPVNANDECATTPSARLVAVCMYIVKQVGLCFIWSGLVAPFSLRWEFGVDPQGEKPDDGLRLVLSADQASSSSRG